MDKNWKKREQIATELKVARVRKKLTQAELADKLKMAQSFVYKYESCERRLEVMEFITICKTLDADPHEIIDKVNK